MKICRYCNCEYPNETNICSSCGAKEFSYKCENCGNRFDEGLFCPRCGVKAGQKPKVCPNCRKEYYSNVCPDCGYGASSNETTRAYNTVPQVSEKKGKTWLWVLGWIFIFPVPLTILMIKNQKLTKWVKIAIIVVAWIIYLFIGLSGGTG